MLSQGKKSDSGQKSEMEESVAPQGYNTCILSLKRVNYGFYLCVQKDKKYLPLEGSHISGGI